MASTLQETVREDGLRVITKRLEHTKKLILAASALAGLADDRENAEGCMHFFEHMAFKGTATKSRKEIKNLLGRFAVSNAYTDWLRTCYYASAPYIRLSLLQDIIFDIYSNPTFPQDEIEKEKEVVLNETAESENNDYSKADHELSKLLWEKNPVRRVSCGTPEGLKAINRDLLFEEHGKWYLSSNTAIVAAGRVDHKELVEKAFSFFPPNSKKVERRRWDNETEILPSHEKVVIERKDRARGVALWGCKVPRFSSDKEKDIVKILDKMIGGGFDSMLFEEVREKRGFVYSTWSQFYDVAGLASAMTFGAKMLQNRVSEVTELVFDVICNHHLRQDHFARTKEALFDELLMSLESPYEWFGKINEAILDESNAISSLENYAKRRIKELSSVTFEEVIDMREKLIVPERMACAIIKPV